jgi:hypothetical protein
MTTSMVLPVGRDWPKTMGDIGAVGNFVTVKASKNRKNQQDSTIGL